MIYSNLKSKTKLILCLSFSFIFVLMCFLSSGISADSNNKVYTLDQNYFSKDSYRIIQNNSLFFIVNDYQTHLTITQFDSSSGEYQKLFENNNSIVGVDVKDDDVFIAEKQTQDTKNYLSVSVFDINDYTNPKDNFLYNLSDYSNDCLYVDKNDKFFVLSADRCFITSLNTNNESALSEPTTEPVTFNIDNAPLTLTKDSSHNIYAQTNNSNRLFSLSQNGFSELVIPDTPASFPLSLISDNALIDSSGKIFYISDEDNSLVYSFATSCNNNVACIDNDIIYTLCSDCILLLDLNSCKESGQIDIKTSPHTIKSTEQNLICFSDSQDTLTILITDKTAKPVDLRSVDVNSNLFVFTPDKITDLDSDMQDFSVMLDKDNIIAGNRGPIEVQISYNDTTLSLTTENGVDFNGCDEIKFTIEDLTGIGNYYVSVFGLCDTSGKPLKLNFTLEVSEPSKEPSKSPSSDYISSSEEPQSKKPSSSSQDESSSENESVSEYSELDSDIYTIDTDRKFILGVQSATTIAMMKNHLNCKNPIFYDQSGDVVKSGKVGTGFLVKPNENDSDDDCFTIILYGDLTGEGNINSRDLTLIIEYVLQGSELEPYRKEAADLNCDGVVDEIDIACLNNMI
ncbi:MAG: dockerin type I repeat-containing protein [Clostridia bacterium]|nr:dockerin type I repeat-containing protein [Clostridia bacterium]